MCTIDFSSWPPAFHIKWINIFNRQQIIYLSIFFILLFSVLTISDSFWTFLAIFIWQEKEKVLIIFFFPFWQPQFSLWKFRKKFALKAFWDEKRTRRNRGPNKVQQKQNLINYFPQKKEEKNFFCVRLKIVFRKIQKKLHMPLSLYVFILMCFSRVAKLFLCEVTFGMFSALSLPDVAPTSFPNNTRKIKLSHWIFH